MKEKLTAIYRKSLYGYIGYIEELPGANSQGVTLEETKSNLAEAVMLILEVNRQLTEKNLAGEDVIREDFGLITM
ncbi:MAG: type II toxin-antitoxin system HicB family antitoxin [Nitrospirae bacterium]|nr:type II toxin-antitoxin system HicB family antitoxin [Nitrospirota bacterium]MBF0536531.1 type II toxin-antitoxin system HicB family antitoxin [Nitrospirota bacterium]MBF0616618.1 type II toxin-antitoxin system HicB family antitoxin [Nitrospirota bacterium]